MSYERVQRRLARHLAALCSQSYRTQPEVDGYELIETVHYNTDDATVYWRPGRLVVAVRGTEVAGDTGPLKALVEWFYNLTFRPERWALVDVHVHRGFLAHFRGLWDQVVQTDAYERHVMSDDEIIYTGHSRGGAIAQLAALYERPDLVCTFGSPRVGGRSFVERCREQSITHWRVVNTLDLVPHLPPGIWFRHYSNPKFRASVTGTHPINQYREALA